MFKIVYRFVCSELWIDFYVQNCVSICMFKIRQAVFTEGGNSYWDQGSFHICKPIYGLVGEQDAARMDWNCIRV